MPPHAPRGQALRALQLLLNSMQLLLSKVVKTLVSQQVAEAEMQKTVKKVWDINKAEEDEEKLRLLSLAMEPGQERFPVFVWHGFCD